MSVANVAMGREGGDLMYVGELELGEEPDPDPPPVRVRGGHVRIAGEFVRQVLQGVGVA